MAYKKLKYWFDKELAILLADKITRHYPDFDRKAFVSAVDQQVPELELKDRVEVITDELYKALDHDYSEGLQILMQILGPENPEETGMFTNYYWVMPIAKYVEKYGLDFFNQSMQAIEEITRRNTGEYTIRPFIEKYPVKTIDKMKTWSNSPNFHVRRLASEGVRPRLPWASKLDQFIIDPSPILPILSNLNDDPSRYVQKSVANCLNDILKDNVEIGRSLLDEWSQGEMTGSRKWIIRHALRKQVKDGKDWAIQLQAQL